jgi:probable F420-dependent oxidoreductase
MDFGISTPMVASPDATAWDRRPDPDLLANIAGRADALGYHHMTCPEQIAVPADHHYAEWSFWDPVSTFGFLSGVTSHIRLVSYVLIIGLHHPLEIAKRFGTLDLLSRGRVIIGVGLGNLPEEFAAMNASYEDRGARADDAIRALRGSLSRREVAYEGTYYHYRNLVVEPRAVQARVPLWIGGHTKRSLRRAIEMGDAWVPPPAGHRGPEPNELATLLRTAELPDGFDIAVGPGFGLDPAGQPDHSTEVIGQWAEAGATIMTVAFDNRSSSHYIEQLEAFATVAKIPPPSS